MLRRIFAIVLVVLGLATIGAAIASGTIWRPDEQVRLTLPSEPDVPLVITEPGVLSAVNDDVEVRIVGASDDTPLVLAMGRESDVLAWVDDAPHWVITGLTDWETLSYLDSRDAATDAPSSEEPTSGEGTSDESGSASEEPSETASGAEGDEGDEEAATVPDPAGSDLWVEEVDGTGELTYSWTEVPGRWVMLVASDGTAPAPQVELTWEREVTTPFVQPGIILGAVIALIGLVLLIVQLLSDLERRRARRAAAAQAETTEIVAAVATDADRPLTRREIRLAAASKGSKAVSAASSASPEESEPAADDGPEGAASQPDDSSEAGSIDDWIRSGSASPLLHEGERTTPDDLTLTEDQSAALEPGTASDEGSDESSEPETSSRGSWWRRRRDRSQTATATAPATEADAPSVPEPEAPESHTEEIPAVEPDEPSPQVSGASWRETWGLGSIADDEAAGPSKEEDR